MAKLSKTGLVSSAAGGAATARGVEYQIEYATLLVLVLVHKQRAAPQFDYEVTLEPRQMVGGKGTAWDISTAPENRLIEAKLHPTSADISEWIDRVRQRGLTGPAAFDLVYSSRGGKLVGLERLSRIARESTDSAHFSQLLSAEGLSETFRTVSSFGSDARQLLARMNLVQCPQSFLQGDIRLHADFLVGAADAKRLLDLLSSKLTGAMSSRLTLDMKTLIQELRHERFNMYPLPEIDRRGLPAAAVETLALLSILRDPLPLAVIAASRSMTIQDLLLALQPAIDAKLISVSEQGVVMAPNGRSLFEAKSVQAPIAATLDALLTHVKAADIEAQKAQLRNLSSLSSTCKDTHPAPVACVFPVLDKVLKQLGDKHAVLKTAMTSVEAARHTAQYSQRSDQIVGLEAHSLICGVSWVYQRIGRLSEARAAAERSLELGQSLGWDRNSAFCKKCIGRLCRMEAEAALDPTIRAERYNTSIGLLQEAIGDFSRLEGFGPEHAEVGDCYSLLGRTYLSMGRLEDAATCATKAHRLVTDKASKDYLDLIILLGDIAAARKQEADASGWYDEAISISNSGGAEITEMRARAFRQRGLLRRRQAGQEKAAAGDFHRAADIWETLGENELSAAAWWEALTIENPLTPTVTDELMKERALVRKLVIEAHNASIGSHDKRNVARRDEPAIEYWRQQIQRAKAKAVLEDVSW